MSDRAPYIAPAPRLPDDTPSFEWMISDSIHTVASRETPYHEAARLFGDRYGLVLALTDAFRDEGARSPALRRGFELTRGVLAHAKKHLHDAWDARTRPSIDRDLDDLIRRATPPPGAARTPTKTPAALPDPFASIAKVIRSIDRQPERAKAATEFAVHWALLRHTPLRLRELREEASAEDREHLDGVIRSAGRWYLDLEESWAARTFDELLGRPTIAELLRLVFPPPG